MNLKRTVFTVLVSFASAFGAIAVYNHFGLNKQQVLVLLNLQPRLNLQHLMH